MVKRLTYYDRAKNLGVDIDPNSEVEEVIRQYLKDFYKDKSHNYNKKFFDEYFSNIVFTDNALTNLYEYIKYRTSYEGRIPLLDLKYIALKYNIPEEDEESLLEKQIEIRKAQGYTLERFQEKYGELQGEFKYNLSLKFIRNIPPYCLDLIVILEGIIKSLPFEQEKIDALLFQLQEDGEEAKESLSAYMKKRFVENDRGPDNRTLFYYRLYDYFIDITEIEGCIKNLIVFLPTNFSRISLTLEAFKIRTNSYGENAEDLFQAYKKKSTDRSLEAFIERHGEKEGKEKYELYLKRCSDANQKKKEIYKEDYEYKIRVNNKRCREYYTSRGFSEEEAVAFVSDYQRKNSGNQVEYLVSKGYSKEEAKEHIESFMNRLGSSYEYIKEKYPDDWENIIHKRLEKFRKTINADDLEWKDDWETYSTRCRALTKTSVQLYKDFIKGSENLNNPDYVVDHQFSVKAGFLAGIDPEVVSHHTNLEVLESFENSSKGLNCSKYINELFRDFYNEVMK